MAIQSIGLGVLLVDQASPGLARLSRSYGILDTQLKATKVDFEKLGSTSEQESLRLQKGITGIASGMLLLGAVGGKLNKMWADNIQSVKQYQTAATDLQFALNLTGKEMIKMKNTIFKEYSRGMYDVIDATKAYYQIASAGIQGKAATRYGMVDITASTLKEAQKFAQFSGQSLEQSADFVRDLYFKTGMDFRNMLEDGTNELSRTLDIFAKSSVLTAIKPEQMQVVLNSTRTAMREIGAVPEDMIAITGALMSAGKSSAEAGQSYNALARKFAMDARFQLTYEKLYMNNAAKDKTTIKQKWELLKMEDGVLEKRLKSLQMYQDSSTTPTSQRGTIGMKRKLISVDLLFGDGATGSGYQKWKKSMYNDDGSFRRAIDYYKDINEQIIRLQKEGTGSGIIQGILQGLFGDQMSKSAFTQMMTGKQIVTEDVYKVDKWGKRMADSFGKEIKLFSTGDYLVGASALDYIVASSRDSLDYSKRYADMQKSTFAGAEKMFASAKKNFQVIMGETILPIVDGILRGATKFIDLLNVTFLNNPWLAKTAGIIGAAIAGIISLSGVLLIGKGIMSLVSHSFGNVDKSLLKNIFTLNIFKTTLDGVAKSAGKASITVAGKSLTGKLDSKQLSFLASQGLRQNSLGRIIGANGKYVSSAKITELLAKQPSALKGILAATGPLSKIVLPIAGAVLLLKSLVEAQKTNTLGLTEPINKFISGIASFTEWVKKIPVAMSSVFGSRYKDISPGNYNSLIFDKQFMGSLNSDQQKKLGRLPELYTNLLEPYFRALAEDEQSKGSTLSAKDKDKYYKEALTNSETTAAKLTELVNKGLITREAANNISTRLTGANKYLNSYLSTMSQAQMVGRGHNLGIFEPLNQFRVWFSDALEGLGTSFKNLGIAMGVGGGLGLMIAGLPGLIAGAILGGIAELVTAPFRKRSDAESKADWINKKYWGTGKSAKVVDLGDKEGYSVVISEWVNGDNGGKVLRRLSPSETEAMMKEASSIKNIKTDSKVMRDLSLGYMNEKAAAQLRTYGTDLNNPASQYISYANLDKIPIWYGSTYKGLLPNSTAYKYKQEMDSLYDPNKIGQSSDWNLAYRKLKGNVEYDVSTMLIMQNKLKNLVTGSTIKNNKDEVILDISTKDGNAASQAQLSTMADVILSKNGLAADIFKLFGKKFGGFTVNGEMISADEYYDKTLDYLEVKDPTDKTLDQNKEALTNLTDSIISLDETMGTSKFKYFDIADSRYEVGDRFRTGSNLFSSPGGLNMRSKDSFMDLENTSTNKNGEPNFILRIEQDGKDPQDFKLGFNSPAVKFKSLLANTVMERVW